jgi:hypothetical protein
MAQKGDEAGIRCFDEIFDKADSIFVIEMGYTSEPIYNDKNTDRPSEIDRDWVHKLMEGPGKFDTIELHPLGENGIWRNIFVGFKDPPMSAREVDDFPARFARLTSNAHGHWNDPLAGKKLDVGLQADKSCGKLLLEGWRPDGSVRSTTVHYSPLQSTTVHYSPLLRSVCQRRLLERLKLGRIFSIWNCLSVSRRMNFFS